MFLGIIIELGSLRIWSLAGPIDGGKLVEAIAIQALGDIAWTEDIRIISAEIMNQMSKGTLIIRK